MCDANVSHSPTKCIAKDCARQLTKVLHKSGGSRTKLLIHLHSTLTHEHNQHKLQSIDKHFSIAKQTGRMTETRRQQTYHHD